MKAVESLNRNTLIGIVKALQAWLYLGETGADDDEFFAGVEIWDPDHEWSPADICESMASKLSEYGLVPEFRGDEPETHPTPDD